MSVRIHFNSVIPWATKSNSPCVHWIIIETFNWISRECCRERRREETPDGVKDPTWKIIETETENERKSSCMKFTGFLTGSAVSPVLFLFCKMNCSQTLELFILSRSPVNICWLDGWVSTNRPVWPSCWRQERRSFTIMKRPERSCGPF